MANAYLKAIGFGVIAGMRSMSAPAFVSDHLARAQPPALLQSPLAFLADPRTASVTKVMALGELAADKLPFVPARIAPGPLAARALSGGLCGAAICLAEGEPAERGAFAGALAAIASSFVFYHLRQRLDQMTKLPDPVVALGEDCLMVGIGLNLLKQG